MKNKSLKILSFILTIINGTICILFSSYILNFLPSICAIILIFIGIVGFISGLKNEDHSRLEQKGMEWAIVTFVVGIGVLIRQDNALFIIGIFWGLHGLVKASDYLNEALYCMMRREKFVGNLCKFIIELTLSILLIFDPFSNIQHHIVILGIEMILDTVFDWITPELDKNVTSN